MKNSANFGEQQTGEKTLSEKILGLTPEQRTDLPINAPYCCYAAGNLTPISIAIDGPGMPGLLEEAIKWPTSSTEEKAVIPPPIPEGVSGFWNPEQRIFRSRYVKPLAFGQTVYSPKEVTEALSLQDVFDVIHFLQSGKIFAFFDQFRLLAPPSRNDPLIYQVEYNDQIYNTVLVYRGCPYPYEYPFRPSVFRKFSSAHSVANYEQLRRYVHNLVIEYAWILWKLWLKPIEVETIVQQFKLLPWTYMIDVTYDIDVAIGFSLIGANGLPDHIPCIYQMLIMQPDTYSMGAHSIWNKLDFARVTKQKALSFIGFSETMADPNGFVIALTEHVLASKQTGYGWHHLGIENVRQRIQDIQDKVATQPNWLYPSESMERRLFVRNIIDGIRRKCGAFGIASDLQQDILQRLEKLEVEIN